MFWAETNDWISSVGLSKFGCPTKILDESGTDLGNCNIVMVSNLKTVVASF
jgi:hypothetical protein